ARVPSRKRLAPSSQKCWIVFGSQTAPSAPLIKEESCQGHARDGRAGEVTEGRGSRPRPAARAPARAARPSRRAASASRLVPQLLGHPLGLLLRRPRCLCRAAGFTPEKPHGRPCGSRQKNPTAGRAFSLVMIKVEAVGGGGKHPFRNSACFKFRFKTALGALPSPSFRKQGRLPGVAGEVTWPPSQRPSPLPSGESGYLEGRATSPSLGRGRRDWVRGAGETRTLGGGKQVSFLGGTRAAGACGWEEEKCQLPLFVLKQRQKG
ncbi:hypothetical protein EI555_007887, partial [Monodon monoceros]